jgi:hypothetical protein
VLSQKEADEALALFWGTLECLGAGIDRNEPASWGTDAASLVFTDAGVIHPHGVIQSKATWYVRGVPAVKAAFASLWGTDDLITSFDGICAFRPWHIDRSWRTRGPWFHTDQPPFAPSPDYTGPYGFRREYVQGFVNLVETTPASGGNVVVPVCSMSSSMHRSLDRSLSSRGVFTLVRCTAQGSHKKLEELSNTYKNSGGIPPTHPIFAEGIRAHVGAGDLFLWDSRVLHGNGPGDEDAADALSELMAQHPPQLMRASVYVCMAPRSFASKETLAARQRSVCENVGTGAWCAHPVGHGGKWIESELEASLRELGGKRAPAPGQGWELNERQMALV